MREVLKVVFWGYILIYSIWYINKSYGRLKINKKYFISMIIISSIYIAFYFYMGFIFGFSKSPYNHTVISIFENVIVQVLPIISIEILRAIIASRNKTNKLTLVFLTILFILVEINYNILTNLFSNKEELFKYVCMAILPIIASSFLYTYLALKGSPIYALIYRLSGILVILLSPILPNLDWFLTASLNVRLTCNNLLDIQI